MHEACNMEYICTKWNEHHEFGKPTFRPRGGNWLLSMIPEIKNGRTIPIYLLPTGRYPLCRFWFRGGLYLCTSTYMYLIVYNCVPCILTKKQSNGKKEHQSERVTRQGEVKSEENKFKEKKIKWQGFENRRKNQNNCVMLKTGFILVLYEMCGVIAVSLQS